MCHVEGCEKPVHSKGLCQAHYRRVQRWGSLEEALKHHPKPRTGKTDHRAISAGEKARRAAERAVRRAAKTHCPNEHPLLPENVYVNPGTGQVVCKVCRMNWQRARQGKPPIERDSVGVWNRNKTHCPAGHEYTPENTYYAREQRHCKKCMRAQKIERLYGLSPEQFDALLEAQRGCCGICAGGLDIGRNLHVDHDHTTGAVRGLLCHECNLALGKFKDDIDVLRAAVGYLQRASRSNQGSN